MALLNSKTYIYISRILNPTINLQVKDVRSVPLVLNNKVSVDELCKLNIQLSKQDYDSFETSWDFKVHPFVKNRVDTLEEAYEL